MDFIFLDTPILEDVCHTNIQSDLVPSLADYFSVSFNLRKRTALL